MRHSVIFSGLAGLLLAGLSTCSQQESTLEVSPTADAILIHSDLRDNYSNQSIEPTAPRSQKPEPKTRKKVVYFDAHPITVIPTHVESLGTDAFLNYEIPLPTLLENIQTKGLDKNITVMKSQRILEVYMGDSLIKQYPIELGRDPMGDKKQQGDMKTPEGTFYVAMHVNPSKFGKALLYSYPSIKHARAGLERLCEDNSGEMVPCISEDQFKAIENAHESCETPPQDTLLGSYLEIHGKGNNENERWDWTHGCTALTNSDMEEIFGFAEKGCYSNGKFKTTITILP
jgi:hypothetical protein